MNLKLLKQNETKEFREDFVQETRNILLHHSIADDFDYKNTRFLPSSAKFLGCQKSIIQKRLETDVECRRAIKNDNPLEENLCNVDGG